MFEKLNLGPNLSNVNKLFRKAMAEGIAEMIGTKEVDASMTLEQFVKYLEGNTNATRE